MPLSVHCCEKGRFKCKIRQFAENVSSVISRYSAKNSPSKLGFAQGPFNATVVVLPVGLKLNRWLPFSFIFMATGPTKSCSESQPSFARIPLLEKSEPSDSPGCAW